MDEQFIHYCLIVGDVDNMSLYLKKKKTLDRQFDHPTRPHKKPKNTGQTVRPLHQAHGRSGGWSKHRVDNPTEREEITEDETNVGSNIRTK